jgi:hypothetical protein
MMRFVIRTPEGAGDYSLIEAGGQPVPISVQGPNTLRNVQPNVAAASTVSFGTNYISRLGSGTIMLTAVSSYTVSGLSGPAQVTTSLLRDGTPLAGTPSIIATAPANGTYTTAMTWLDVLPDDGQHSYGVQIAIAAGTVSLTAGQGIIVGFEL